MTLGEAARSLGIRSDTLRRQVHLGKFKAIKKGRDWHVLPAEVERYRVENRRS